MSHFYGTINGRAKNNSTQCGTKQSGLTTVAASYSGAIQVYLFNHEGKDRYVVTQIPWEGSGITKVIEAGTLGE